MQREQLARVPERERERERAHECMCVCVCVCVFEEKVCRWNRAWYDTK